MDVINEAEHMLELCVVTPVLSILVGSRHAVEHTDDYKTVHNGIIYYK